MRLVPGAYAASTTAPFPEIRFLDFCALIQQFFHRDVSLAAVLGFLFTVLRNPDLLSLHYRQKLAFGDERRTTSMSSWGLFMAQEIIR